MYVTEQFVVLTTNRCAHFLPPDVRRSTLLLQLAAAMEVVQSILSEQITQQELTTMVSSVKLIYLWLVSFLKMHDVIKRPPVEKPKVVSEESQRAIRLQRKSSRGESSTADGVKAS